MFRPKGELHPIRRTSRFWRPLCAGEEQAPFGRIRTRNYEHGFRASCETFIGYKRRLATQASGNIRTTQAVKHFRILFTGKGHISGVLLTI